MRRNKRKNTRMFMLILFLLLGIGFAALAANLKIDGLVNVSSASWDVHFENVQITQGSVTANPAPTSNNVDTTEMAYTINFEKPGDFYEFTVDIVNDGSIDAMINVLTNTTYESDGTTPTNLPSYLKSSVKYSDGATIRQYQELLHGTSETIKVRIEYRTDISASDLPDTPDQIIFKFEEEYVQKGNNAIPVRFDADFVDDTWTDIVIAYDNGLTEKLEDAMINGTTREVQLDLDNDGIAETTGHLRIANLSAPQECSQPDFSRTACGLVLEFTDVIVAHRMTAGSNAGGWEHSEIRDYINSVVYNALPPELRERIVDTPVISGYGPYDSANIYTMDKLYLFSPHEIWEDVDEDPTAGIDYFDTSYHNTRQLDYYHDKGVTSDWQTGTPAIKRTANDGYAQWWLRSAEHSYINAFYAVNVQGSPAPAYSYRQDCISPAFRIG